MARTSPTTRSSFDGRVWRACVRIPRGKVSTYKELARAIGAPNASRAVANALGRNPHAPRIPCHRVVRSDGTIGGYSGKGGAEGKRKLLRKEGVAVKNGKIAGFKNKLFRFKRA